MNHHLSAQPSGTDHHVPICRRRRQRVLVTAQLKPVACDIHQAASTRAFTCRVGSAMPGGISCVR